MTVGRGGLALVAAAALWGGCLSVDRPIHPLRLEGYPGAPIEADLFPLAAGARWTFRDRAGGELTMALGRDEAGLYVSGRAEGRVRARAADGYLELVYDGDVVERPLKLAGAVGDHWQAAGARYRVFGYDRIRILDQEVRTLVVAADRGDVRDLFWFARGMGWVRFRTERQGRAVRDAILVAFEPGRN